MQDLYHQQYDNSTKRTSVFLVSAISCTSCTKVDPQSSEALDLISVGEGKTQRGREAGREASRRLKDPQSIRILQMMASRIPIYWSLEPKFRILILGVGLNYCSQNGKNHVETSLNPQYSHSLFLGSAGPPWIAGSLCLCGPSGP